MSAPVQMVGNLTRSAEVVPTKNGSIVKFTVATRRPRRKDEEEETDFFDVSTWVAPDDPTDILGRVVPALIKGLQVSIIEGASIQIDKWEDKDGNKRSKPGVWLRSLWAVNYDRRAQGTSTTEVDEDIPF